MKKVSRKKIVLGLFLNLVITYGLIAQTNTAFDPGTLEENRNTVTTWSYDLNGNLKASNRSYFNDLGRLEQTQSWDPLDSIIWGQETYYDHLGRDALNTLNAPIVGQESFMYENAFTSDALGNEFNEADFDLLDLYQPSKINQNSPLGAYYQGITSNEYQDFTEYPFSRTIYSKLNPGNPLATIGGNRVDTNGNGSLDDDDNWVQPYVFVMPVSTELTLSEAFGDLTYEGIKVLKTVSRDVHGVENVMFTDTDGKLLAVARSGNEENPDQGRTSITHTVGPQGYVDFHIPKGCSGVTLGGGGSLDSQAFQIYDLITEQLVFQSVEELPSGFYRIVFIDKEPSSPYTISHEVNYYNYSLNQYDKADRLIASYQSLQDANGNKLATTYEYNALGQLIKTTSPDEGVTEFKYRTDGQIRFSQNAKQKTSGQYGEFSYTNYDDQGRPIESGVVVTYLQPGASIVTFANVDPDEDYNFEILRERHYTMYDFVPQAYLSRLENNLPAAYHHPTFLSGNVVMTRYSGSDTYYSYDIYGRVTWLVQDIVGLGLKTIDYEYDSLTGLVTRVLYQKDEPSERFIHRYSYNERDELVTVETSTDGTNYTLQAAYQYYENGQMRRTELAGGIQGIDYVYNLNGRLKGINHPSLTSTNDPGNDNNDIFGMQIDYHNSDYIRPNANITTPNYGTNQLNGNIKGIRWNNSFSSTEESMYAYSYDRNNWLVGADFDADGQNTGPAQHPIVNSIYESGQSETLSDAGSVILADGFHAKEGSMVTIYIDAGADGPYDVSNITYDTNGNIQSLKRNQGTQESIAMDDLSYTYKTDKPNQLLRVDDAITQETNAEDIKDQNNVNYIYNEIGQLVYNEAEDLRYFYNTSGLVTEVQKGNQTVVKFFYNDRNHRRKKETYHLETGALLATTNYVRDISGQVMGIYNNTTLTEQPIYGNSLIGVHYRNNGDVYQLTDHLGNVRAVFKKNNNTVQGDGYTDYYPFGMPMPGRRQVDPEGYRYAFQGQEKDPETGKEAFELRLWDSRIGRWLTTDPYGEFASPYLGMGNNPISLTDPDGGMTNGCCNGFFGFLNRLYDNINNVINSIGPNGPDPNHVEAVNLDINTLEIATKQIEKTNEGLIIGGGIAFSVFTLGVGTSVTVTGVGAGVLSRQGLTQLVRTSLVTSRKDLATNFINDLVQQSISNRFDYSKFNILGSVLGTSTKGNVPTLIGHVVDIRLDGNVHYDTDVSSIFIKILASDATNAVHTKIDVIVPDELLSPAGEIYKEIFKNGSQVIIGEGADVLKN